SLMPRPVLDAVMSHLVLESEVGGYEAEDLRADAIEKSYRAVESLIGAPQGSVAFVENATVAFSQALSAIPFRDGDTILTTRNDYVSNHLMYLALRDRFGVRIQVAPEHPAGSEVGGVDAAAMADQVHRLRPRLVAMTHIPTSSGVIQEVAPVARAARDRGIPFLLDACQSVGQIPVDVGEIPCTFLAATSRKFLRGPRGSGFLYVDPAALENGMAPLFPDLRGSDWIEADLAQPAPDARRFENWEFSWALVLGTGEAARYAMDVGMEALSQRSLALGRSLRERLHRIPGVRAMDRGRNVGAIVTVAVEGWEGARLVKELREKGINTSAVDRHSAVLDFDDKGIGSVLRLSPHYFNTDEELEQAAHALESLIT
ncbi:MAG: aminotransferase class V-fold PLP-dependent enzyme, partial [Gemmatimonadales bacterium]